MNLAVPNPGLNPGDKLDKYVVQQQIGAGGMSVVWKGHDALLNRFVAIKQILIDGDDDLQRQRFHKEVQTHRALSKQDKHLVELIQVVEDPRGLFLIMEYVDGPSLEQILTQQRGPMDQKQALGIIGAVALGLKAIHANKIIHRDLKPSNILLPRSGGLKICDFGLATLLAEQQSMAVGTVRYMAPELFGDEPAEPRADIYSLGVIAYEMFAGREKFEEAFKMIVRDERNQAMRWMKWHTNPRVKAVPLSQLNPRIPQTLSSLVERMMEKDAGLRIESAEQLLEAIRRHFAGESAVPAASNVANTPIEPAKAQHVTAPLPQRSRTAIILGAMLLAWLLVGAGLWLYNDMRTQRIAQEKRDGAMQELNLAKQDYDAARYSQVIARVQPLELAWANDQIIVDRSRGFALLAGAHLDLQVKKYDAAIAKLQEAERIPGIAIDRVQALIEQARLGAAFEQAYATTEQLINENSYAEARDRIRELRKVPLTDEEDQRLIELSVMIEDQESRFEATRVEQEALQLAGAGRRDDAITRIQRAQRRLSDARLDQLLQKLELDRRYDNLITQAREAQQSNSLSRAIELYTTAAALKPTEQLSTTINLLKSQQMYERGMTLLAQNNSEAAAAAFTDALGYTSDYAPAIESLKRIESAGQLSSYIRAGDQALASGNYDVAVRQYQAALAMSDDPTVTTKLRNARIQLHVALGQERLRQRKPDEAEQALLQAKELDPGNPLVSKSMNDLKLMREYLKAMAAGDELRAQSKFADAKREYNKASRIDDNDEIRLRLDDAEFYSLIAMARHYMQQQDWTTAKNFLLTAGRMRNNDLVQELLAEVNRNAAQSN